MTEKIDSKLVLSILLLFAGFFLVLTSASAQADLGGIRTHNSSYNPSQSSGIFNISIEIEYLDSLSALGVQETIPVGWSFVSVNGNDAPTIIPASGATGTLDFAWNTPPTSPASFTYTVQIPIDDSGDKALSGQVLYRRVGGELIAAIPDTVLSGDTDGDGMNDSWEIANFGDLSKDDTGDEDIDGLTNLEEFQNLTNPGLIDTDGDGYSDYEEIALGTDPNLDSSFPVYLPGSYFVDIASGNDAAGEGTALKPWKTLHWAIHHINGGSAGSYSLSLAAGVYSVGNGEEDSVLILAQADVAILGAAGTVLDGYDALSWDTGIKIIADGTKVSGLKITNFQDAGIVVEDSSPIIEKNIIYDQGTVGIDIYGNTTETSPIIRNNLIYFTTGVYTSGIFINTDTGVSNPLIYHNTIDGGMDSGIFVDGTLAAPEINYNIITNFGMYGIYINNGSPVIDYNNVWNNGAANHWPDTIPGVNDISADPLYGSYALQLGSPSIDAIPLGSDDPLTEDIDGNPRPHGLGFDMGAYEFSTPLYLLTLSTTGSGSVTLNPPGGRYYEGAEVQITATPDQGWRFESWTGDVAAPSSAATTVTMDTDKSITAAFTTISYDLIVNIDGPGVVDPPGGTYNSGAIVELDAAPDAGCVFLGWSGDLTGSNVTMDSNKTVTAEFNCPPDTPLAITPSDGSTMASGPAYLDAGAFSDYDRDTHTHTYWRVRRADSVYGRSDYDPSFDFTATSSPLTTHTVSGLADGMQYVWKVGYTDSGSGVKSWSQESTFTVGTSALDILPEVEPGTGVASFKMLSFTHWPNDPSAEAVFALTYDTSQFRIGAYDPVIGGYIEYGNGLKILPGRAYWVLSRYGLDIAYDGVPVSLTQDIEIPLSVNPGTGLGWNMIGSPNEANYNWADVEVVEYGADGAIVFGPTPVSDLSDPNDYIYKTLWRWDGGTYSGDTAMMEKYEGYWVRARKANVFLRFPVAAQVSAGGRSFRAAAFGSDYSRSEEPPPMPPGSLAAEGGEDAHLENPKGGCFIDSTSRGLKITAPTRMVNNIIEKYFLPRQNGERNKK